MFVAVYSDEPLLVAGLIGLSANSEFKVSKCCSTIAELVTWLSAEGNHPDVILLNDAPELSFQRLVDIRRAAPHSKLILWTREVSPETAQHLLDTGVTGILRKDLPFNLVELCIKKVGAGEIWIERALVESLLRARRVTLSRRERQLLRLISCGLSNKQIAEELFLSEGTVKVYLSRLFRKTGVQDRFELAIFGLRHCKFPSGVTAGRASAEETGWPSVLVLSDQSGTNVT